MVVEILLLARLYILNSIYSVIEINMPVDLRACDARDVISQPYLLPLYTAQEPY